MQIVIGCLLIVGAIIFFLVKKLGASPTGISDGTSVPPTLDDMILAAANRYGTEAALVKAIVKVESDFDSSAVNPSDPSYGLMQITPSVAADYGLVKDPYNPSAGELTLLMDPQMNLNIGSWLLHRLLFQTGGDFDTAVQMYNEGPANYRAGKRVPDYLAKVKEAYDAYKLQ